MIKYILYTTNKQQLEKEQYSEHQKYNIIQECYSIKQYYTTTKNYNTTENSVKQYKFKKQNIEKQSKTEYYKIKN